MLDEVSARLASGNTVRATQYAIEVTDAEGNQLTVVDAHAVAEVKREAATIRLRRFSGEVVELGFPSFEEAGIFEHALRDLRARTLPTRTEQTVKTYASQDEFQRDSQRMAQDGWRVTNTMERNPPIGVARGCLLGLFALVWRPKPEIVVTYERTAQ